MILGSGLLQASGWSPTWLIRDEFTDTRAAGSVNGTAATPGPGTRATAGANFEVGSGYAANTAIAGWNNAYLAYGAQTRAAGLAHLAKVYFPSKVDPFIFGWATAATPGTYNTRGVYQISAASLSFWSGATVATDSALAIDTWHNVVSVLRVSGELFVTGTLGAWKLQYVYAPGTTATVYPSALFNNICRIDGVHVTQLPAPFDTDDGLATDTHSGSVAAGTTFVHEGNALIEYTLTTRPTADNADVFFRVQDASNYWICRVNSSGDISLIEVVAGTPTTRGTAAGVVSSGHRVVIIADSTTVRLYSNDTLRVTYASATNFATATAGEVDALGTGGAISNLKTWPRTLSGTAASILNKASA